MHHTYVKVRSYHLDGFGHVNNARYLEFLEEARWSYFDNHQLMDICIERQIGFVVANIDISFRKATITNDELDIQTVIHSIGTKSKLIKQTIFLKGTDVVICAADVTMAIIDLTTGKSISIDEEIRLLIEK